MDPKQPADLNQPPPSDQLNQTTDSTTAGTTSESAGSGSPTEAAAQPAAETCSHCNQPLGPAHERADDCLPAEADNPHGVSRGQLRRYPEPMRELVLKHGVQLYGFAFIVATSNSAINQWMKVAHNLRHLRQPTQVILDNFEHLFAALCGLHEWDFKKDVLPLVLEIQQRSSRAVAQQRPSLILPEGAKPH